MKAGVKKNGTFLDIPLSKIDESYSSLRLIHPQANASMVESIHKFGQLSPVVVGLGQEGRYELIDGFKRFRALKQLGFEHVTAKLLEVSIRALKAAMICLNWKKGSISDLEEAMVIHSLYHDDGLTQVEIATLLGRHKSWVCRRFSLIERLCNEVLDHIRLGLIKTSIGRELARLPRGNQQTALSTILKYRLCSRETARFVSLLLQRPRWDREKILRFPEEIISDRCPDRPRNYGLSKNAIAVHEKFMDIERLFLTMSDTLSTDVFSKFTKEDWRQILSIVQRIDKSFNHIKSMLMKAVSNQAK